MIIENLARIQQRIEHACIKSQRASREISIVGVSKGRSLAEIQEAALAGISDIGENKVQEAIVKFSDQRLAMSDKRLRWHMVGHLQTNKVKEAVGIFDLIHSVDSLHLAGEIEKQALKLSKVQDVLIQVNTSGEQTKFGLKPQESIEAIRAIGQFTSVKVLGLMTIAPLNSDQGSLRRYFRSLRELRDKINTLHITHNILHILSMGMSDDFEVAIEEGATMLRIGRGIFES